MATGIPFLDNVISGAGQAGSDILNQLFTGQANTFYNQNYQPKSPIVKNVEGGISTGIAALDKALGNYKISDFPNSPSLGDIAGNISDTLAGKAKPGTSGNKSVLALLPMLSLAGEGMSGEGATAEETATTAEKTATGEEVAQTAANPARIKLDPSVYGAEREAAVQKTIDNVVPGVTATEKYTNLAPTMRNLGEQIDTIMAQNPKTASIDQIMQDYDANLKDQGIYRTTNASKDVVQKTARQYVTDLYNEAVGGKENINPSEISDSSLLKLKQQANADAQSVYKKIQNGTTLTDKDQVIKAARQTFDDTLSTLHPEVKDLTTQQSHLYDAPESLLKGREAEFKAAEKAANVPKDPNALTSFLKGSVSSIPHLATSATILGALGIGGYGVYANSQIPKNYQFSSGNVTIPAISDIKDSQGSPLTINPSDMANQIKNINDQEQQVAFQARLGIPDAQAKYDQLEEQKQSLTSKYTALKPIYDQHVETQNVIDGLNTAQKAIKAANPTFLQAYGSLGGLLTGVRASIDPNYSTFIQTLNNLHQLYGVDVSNIINSGSRESADAAINQTVKAYIAKLQNTVKNAGGTWPGENQQINAGDFMKAMMQGASGRVNSGNNTLNNILSP